MTNGHPSWINANYAIWFNDVANDWMVGNVGSRGRDLGFMYADDQGSTCPFDITANWNLFYGGQWNLVAGTSFTCSQAKSKKTILNTEYTLGAIHKPSRPILPIL